jgi:hypothetical protein
MIALSVSVAVLSLAACGNSSESTTSMPQTGPLRIGGGGIAQFRQRGAGADNSIEEYGREGSRAELTQAAENVHAYLVARAEGDWPTACSLIGEILKLRLRAILEFSHQPLGRNCAERMRRIAPGEPAIARTRYEATEVDAASIRVDGHTGFLFFNPDNGGRKLILAWEGGEWKTAGLLPTPLH